MSDSQGTLDDTVVKALDQAPYALSLGELARRVSRQEQVVEAALLRLITAGRVKMTADSRTRAYYTKNEHLL
ncbi:MAG: hypothetical protein E6K11_10850 [Methanobacteriota archaeon]|nr:MAG: hypothetical protein E6K11_10850 [Euryarchaeota archaeon]